jgi:hypothetical protein
VPTNARYTFGKAVALATFMLALPATAAAIAPASRYDAPGQRHAKVCAKLASAGAPLRFGDGRSTGFSVTRQLTARSRTCARGSMTLDLHEILPSSSGPLAFQLGGHGYAHGASAKYGAVSVADVAGPLPAPAPSGGGRGAACALATGQAYQVNVRSIPAVMHYKRPQDLSSGSNSGTSFMHYGDPGADQGTGPPIHYSYLLWSFLDVHGGGMVRTLLAPGQVVRPCDVSPITMPSWDARGAVNGSVTARYVRVLAGSCPLYGWMVWSHTQGGGAAVAHARPLGSNPPQEPRPDARCPA